jgi:hypothetical protein
MRRATGWLTAGALAALAAGVVLTPTVRGGEVGYVEDFALARDRAAALRQLIPGTEDYYYYHALHLLNTGRFDQVEPLTKVWHERHNQTPRLTEIQTRHALLTYDQDPAKSLAYLRDRLGLRFDHQKETVGVPPALPTALDPRLIARDTLKASSIPRWGNLDNFEDPALDWMAGEKLTWENRRQLLSRLQRPDVPNLARLVNDDFAAPHAQAFGSLPVHRLMTREQLDELLKLNPGVLNVANFVNAYMAKLQPGADDDWKRDPRVTKAYLERMQAFADKLPPAFNAVKAHVQFHRLAFDRSQGVYDRGRFVEYIKLPRNQPYMAARWNERDESRRWPADLNADLGAVTLLPPVGADEALVRDYLQQFLLAAENTQEWEPYIDETFVRHLFAETKIVGGVGDPERWASLLPPDQFRQLKDRVDLDFAPANKTEFGADEPITMEVFVKNAPSLLVKVYEINTRHFYRTFGREVDTDVNLDGLVANAERVIPGGADPFRRTKLTLTFPDPQAGPNFPEPNRPGVYVIDLIGNGKSSRALVRKGRLYPLVSTGTAGQVVRVVDEKHRPVADATVWLNGQEFTPDKDGAVVVPFSTAPGRQPVVISRGDFACLDHLHHQPEAFRLTAGIHVDRESLLAQRVAPVLVRPGLTLNGRPVSVNLLEDVRLRITSADHDGVPSSVEVPDFKLFEDRESIHEVRVPPRLASLTVALTAKVKVLSTGQTVDLSAAQTFTLNGLARTDRIEDLHLARFGGVYVVELRGRTGEPKPDRAVTVALKHREFKEPVTVSLKTDAGGRVTLGALADIAAVTATGPEGTARTWDLTTDRHTYRQLVHARAGEVVALPYLGTAGKPDRAELALFEVRGSDIRADRFAAIGIKGGMVELRDLAPGDYDLLLKQTGEKVRVRVAAGDEVAGNLLSPVRHLERPLLKPVQVESITADNDTVTIRLRDASKFTRVHVFATRYQPAFGAFGNLGKVRDAELGGMTPAHAPSVYLTGRNIGDELRYVLERRNQKKFPGNMLERPGLLLNPWAVRTTETGEQLARAGDDFAKKGGVAEAAPQAPPAPKSETRDAASLNSTMSADLSPDLDFLYDAAAVAVNLTPDADGVVKLPRKDVGPHPLVQVVAVDPLHTTARTVSLPEQKARFADLRLRDGLDPAGHFAQQKQATVVEPGQPFVIADAAASRYETYDSLAKVYNLYATLGKDPKLAEFAFVLRWPTLKEAEKRELYSKYACHELHYFLSRKDPKFFNEVVRPYLAHKKDKTFLDHWLLGDDLGRFLRPWEYGRLNAPERVLLARRAPGEPARVARHFDDLLRLTPPNAARELFEFGAAIEGEALGLGDEAKARLRQELAKKSVALGEVQDLALNGAMPAPAGQPMGGAGGFGGGMPESARAGLSVAGREGRSAGRGGKLGADKKEMAKDAPGEQAEMKLLMKSAEEADRFYFDDREKHLGVRQLYRKVDPTQEWAENNYYKLLVGQQTADLVPVSPFWAEYAAHTDGPFVSRHLPAAARNFTEMMFALSVLDLPFEPARHEVKFEDGRMTLTPGSRVVAFHEEVRPAEVATNPAPILVSQNVYRANDRFRDINGEREDKFVAGEFVAQVVYGCQVVVTNPSSSRQRLSVLVQVPVGAVPLGGAKYTRSVPLDLEPYRTHTMDTLFYFPRPGTFAHFPVHVAKDERVVASAKPATFAVLAKPSKLDTESWDYVSQEGTNDDVLAFLNRENVRALNLDRVLFRLKDRAFFEAVVRLLQDRHLFHPGVYSYALLHADAAAARQFLQHQDAFVAEAGGPLASPLLDIDPVARHQFEHLEYKPLVNARAHSLGNRRQIVNDRLHEQYHHLLKTLTYRTELNDADLLAVTYYLLLQDRVDEALAAFARVNRDAVPTKVQYDYCAAYLALSEGNTARAGAIAAGYEGHPVDRWRNAFAAVRAQVDEAEGRGQRLVDKDDRDQAQGQLVAGGPGFELAVTAAGVNLTWQNLESVRVNYYRMDVELLFSTNPFVGRGGSQFAAIRPNASEVVALPRGRTKHTVPIPAEFDGRNVLVEVSAAGQTRAVPFFATTMTVTMTENYGQLRVTDAAAGRPVPKAYVKVYAKLADGSVKFHKDGYTDLRGRFDYASVSTPERQGIDRFAVLVLSDDRGAVIREAAPPQR